MTDHEDHRADPVRLATAMEGAMDGMAIRNAADEYVYLNQAHADIYGYDSPADRVDETWRCLYDAEEVPRFEEDTFPVIRADGTGGAKRSAGRQSAAHSPRNCP